MPYVVRPVDPNAARSRGPITKFLAAPAQNVIVSYAIRFSGCWPRLLSYEACRKQAYVDALSWGGEILPERSISVRIDLDSLSRTRLNHR